MIQIGGVYTTFCQEEGILLQKYAIEMGGVSRYFSKVSGSGVALTLLNMVSISNGISYPLILRSRPPFTGVPRGPGRNVPVLLGTWLGVPQRVLFECLEPQKRQKALTKHSVRHSEPGA